MIVVSAQIKFSGHEIASNSQPSARGRDRSPQPGNSSVILELNNYPTLSKRRGGDDSRCFWCDQDFRQLFMTSLPLMRMSASKPMIFRWSSRSSPVITEITIINTLIRGPQDRD